MTEQVNYEDAIAPHSEFQERYLNSDAQIILVGGAAGSSKSYVGLMRHLRFVEDPNYRAYCLRKNSSAIMSSGGLFWEAVGLYQKYDPNIQVKLRDQKIVFSSGAEISFSHYENSSAAMKYQGLQLSSLFFDEITHLDFEEDIWWLWSRLRSKAKNIHSMWWSCNPDPDHFTMRYASYYLYPEGHPLAGRPDPEKNGTIRYLLRIGGDIVWGDTAEELKEKYGEDKAPISFQGLFGTIEDNPPLMAMQPEYMQNLEALPTVDRERLRFGNWLAREASSSYFDRKNCTELLSPPPESEIVKTVRAYDFAGTLPNDSNRYPDFFASVKMSKLKNGNYVVTDVVRTHLTFGEWETHILDNARRDGSHVDIILPQDPNAAARASTSLLVRSIAENGFVAKTKRSSQGKLDSFRPFASAAEVGAVAFVKGCATDLWNKIDGDNTFLYNELEQFDGRRSSSSRKDDLVDCCSLAFSTLAQRVNLPNISSAIVNANLAQPNLFHKSR